MDALYSVQIVDRRLDGEAPLICPRCKSQNPDLQNVIAFQRHEVPIDHYSVGCEACGLLYHADVYHPGADAPPAVSGPSREVCPGCYGGTPDPDLLENPGDPCPLCEGTGQVWAGEMDGQGDTSGQPLLFPQEPRHDR